MTTHAGLYFSCCEFNNWKLLQITQIKILSTIYGNKMHRNLSVTDRNLRNSFPANDNNDFNLRCKWQQLYNLY